MRLLRRPPLSCSPALRVAQLEWKLTMPHSGAECSQDWGRDPVVFEGCWLSGQSWDSKLSTAGPGCLLPPHQTTPWGEHV